jgi:hypothetical protein
MTAPNSKYSLYAIDEDELREALGHMVADETMNTTSSYSANTLLHPDNRISFIETHIAYIKAHPAINPRDYLANLRLKIRQR